jgi:uncharacterized membrane protein YfcA
LLAVSDWTVIAPFAIVVAVAVYFHTVTGFGLAMIVMGVASGMGIASVATLAAVISIVTLLNSAVALRGNLHHVNWRIARGLVAGVLPASVLGVILLEYLSSAATDLVQLLLGLVIIYGGVNFAWRPAPLREVSSPPSFAAFGFLGGLIGGLFGIPGPPLIFQFYRQPMSLAEIRSFLIFINAVIAGARTLFVGAQGGLSEEVLLLSAVCLPITALATVAGRRYPPPFHAETMRRIAFVVLVLMGAGLMFPVLASYM